MNPIIHSISTFSSILLSGNAYLDPGSGSFILQLLIATLVGGMFILKTYWKKIMSFFRERSSKHSNDPEE
jgi:ABC-type polysaccharide/polyol phosphate export permease